MKKKLVSKSAFFNPRVLIGFAFCSVGVFLVLHALAQSLTSEQKQPLDRGPGMQVAEIPSRIGYLQRQPNPRVPQLVGTDLGVESEPNNTFATANFLGVNPEGKIKGYNLSGGPPPSAGTDDDWYSFTTTVPNSKIYAATMTSGSGGGNGDTVLEVIASDGSTVLELDDEDGTFGGSSSSIAGTLLATPGTYYLRVTNSFRPPLPIAPYDLYFAVRSGAPTAETEPNNNGTPQVMPASQYVSGVVDPVGG